MTRIRFKADEIFESIGPNKGPLFPKDFVLDESDVGAALGIRQEPTHAASFVDRWVNMGLAVRVGEDVPASDPKSIVVIGGPVTEPIVTDAAADDEPASDDLSTLTRDRLDALAAKRGVDIAGAKNKADVIAALELAAEAAAK